MTENLNGTENLSALKDFFLVLLLLCTLKIFCKPGSVLSQCLSLLPSCCRPSKINKRLTLRSCKIDEAAKHYIGCLRGGQNTLFTIAAKQCLGCLIMLDDA